MNARCNVGLVLPSGTVERVILKRSYSSVLTVEWRGTIVTVQVTEDGRLMHIGAASYPPVCSEEVSAGGPPVFVTMEVEQ
jgi:hypothetical protein